MARGLTWIYRYSSDPCFFLIVYFLQVPELQRRAYLNIKESGTFDDVVRATLQVKDWMEQGFARQKRGKCSHRLHRGLCSLFVVDKCGLPKHVPLARLDNSKQQVQCQGVIMVQETKSNLKQSAANADDRAANCSSCVTKLMQILAPWFRK